MKRIPWIFFLISLSITVFGQRSADYGVFGGVASYLGDINPERLLYSPGPAGGVFYRYNLHPRQALRANIFYAGVRQMILILKTVTSKAGMNLFPDQ